MMATRAQSQDRVEQSLLERRPPQQAEVPSRGAMTRGHAIVPLRLDVDPMLLVERIAGHVCTCLHSFDPGIGI
jgi:hypothetical protein